MQVGQAQPRSVLLALSVTTANGVEAKEEWPHRTSPFFVSHGLLAVLRLSRGPIRPPQ